MPEKIKDNKNCVARISTALLDELEGIAQKRLSLGIDKKKRSLRQLTRLLVKHYSWKKIKDDMLVYNNFEVVSNDE